MISTANIVVNLLILGAFKYYNFFAESFAELFSSFGYQIDTVTLNVILPVGISFYTFQALSYSIDVYQGKIKPTKDIIQFFTYISFFPQLVAGPIERATNLLPQFNRERTFDYSKSVDGLRQMLCGFFKKVVVADLCAYYVNQYWDNYVELPGLMLIQIAVLFTFQIYCDFSGYSDIAIGCAKMFGIRLKMNFDKPYLSRNIAEFWRRWHISLMTWFRDYVYIPLGGNRCAAWKVYSNILIVFLLSGLWHGANWTFVVWGGYNAFLLIGARVLGCNHRYSTMVAEGKLLPDIKEALSILLTFIFVVIGWIVFRSQSLSEAIGFFLALICNEFVGEGLDLLMGPLAGISFLVVVEWATRKKQYALEMPMMGIMRNKVARLVVYYILVIVIYSFWGYAQDFIYFQF